MSTSKSTPARLARSATRTPSALVDGLASAAGAVVAALRFVAFWFAALAPLTYVPLLAAGVVGAHPLTFVGLIGANVVAMVVGHGHRRPA